jgi:cytochrome b subunit of formate dehydrogenase
MKFKKVKPITENKLSSTISSLKSSSRRLLSSSNPEFDYHMIGLREFVQKNYALILGFVAIIIAVAGVVVLSITVQPILTPSDVIHRMMDMELAAVILFMIVIHCEYIYFSKLHIPR